MKSWLKIPFACFCLCLGMAFITGCDPDPGIPVTTVSSASHAQIKKTTIDRAELETVDGKLPVRSWEVQISSRNPFKGFSDNMLAEMAQQQQLEMLNVETAEKLPEQRYGVKDYTLVGVITGTAYPKAYVIDPEGNRFVLGVGDLIGNNNGTVQEIRRKGLTVVELISSEGVLIELPLYNEEPDIKYTLQ